MNYILIILLGLIAFPFIFGPIQVCQIEFIVDIKHLSSPYYRVGIFYEPIPREDDIIQEEFSIGLFFINLVVVFYKLPDNIA